MSLPSPTHKRPITSGRSLVICVVLGMVVSLVGLFVHKNQPPQPLFTATKQTLTTKEIDSLKRLGLTPKEPIFVQDLTNGKSSRLHGRFLHITDVHPDPYYKTGSRQDEMCHSGKGDAGKYGDAVLGCDSPMVLMNDTFQWIKDNLEDKIDFIVWTGDNIRHDNDRRYPRTEENIFDMNQLVSDAMYSYFGDISVPSLGNNDVYPHNLFAPGPTLQTREMFKIWRNFIPQAQLHIFNRGAYFFKEVVPGKMAVLSINTLYLFQSNPLVDNCDRKKEPGYRLFEWLGVVLKEMRKRNMKVWLTGHVPPNEKNYDESCLRKYIIWSHEYRDIIVGGLYGHMNIDHFIPLDAQAAYKSLKSKYASVELDINYDSDDDTEDSVQYYNNLNMSYAANLPQQGFETLRIRPDFSVAGGVPNNKVAYMESLRKSLYGKVKGKKKSGKDGERYSIAHVTASVVPTFNSGLRVWEYNITDLQDSLSLVSYKPWDSFFQEVDYLLQEHDEYDEKYGLEFEIDDEVHINRDKTIPPKMPKNLPLGPAYVHQEFTPERFVQYYADLKSINKGKKDFGYEKEYATDDKVFKMKSLTVREWLKLARTLGKPVKGKLKELTSEKVTDDDVWNHFLKYSFVSSDYENMGYG